MIVVEPLRSDRETTSGEVIMAETTSEVDVNHVEVVFVGPLRSGRETRMEQLRSRSDCRTTSKWSWNVVGGNEETAEKWLFHTSK